MAEVLPGSLAERRTNRPENVDYYNGTTRSTRYKVAYSYWGIGSGTMRWRVRAIHLADKLHPRKVSAWHYLALLHGHELSREAEAAARAGRHAASSPRPGRSR